MFFKSWLPTWRSHYRRGRQNRSPVRFGPRKTRSPAEVLEVRAMLSTITVTSLDDNLTVDGQITLREAIQAANTDMLVDGVLGSGPDIITFDPSLISGGPATIRLNGTALQITSDVTITGPGANLLTLNADSDSNGTGNSQVFVIDDGNGVADLFVEMSGMTITKGLGTDGGAIHNHEILTLENAAVTNSYASHFGGGLFNTGTVIINRSTISWNTAPTAGQGGGIQSETGATLTIINSTIAGNTADHYGGGVSSNGPMTIRNSTIASNTVASGYGGGISSSQPFSLLNSIVAGNSGNSPDISCGLTITANYSLIQNTSGANIGGSSGNNITGVSPQLGSLQGNGGPTQTMALLVSSPAINAGTSSSAPSVDQRGALRDSQPDIGAFEVVHNFVVTTTTDEDNGTINASQGTGTSLREAINFANANPGADTITFDANLTSGGPAMISLSGGDLEIASNITIVGPGTHLLTVSGNLRVNDRLQFDGGMVLNGSAYSNGDLIVNGSLGVTGDVGIAGSLSVGGAMSVSGDFFQAGDVAVAGELQVAGDHATMGDLLAAGTVHVSGTFSQTSGSTSFLSGSVATFGSFSQSGGTFGAPSGTMTISGSAFSRTGGDFYHNGGTVDFTGANQVLRGSTAFANFTKISTINDTLTFAASTTQTFSGQFILNGSSGHLLSLRSTVPGTQWNIQPLGSRNVQFVDVQDSRNLSAPPVIASSSMNSGNNTNWTFNTTPIVAVGSNASVSEGATLGRTGSFADPDADTWTATVNYGDGAGAVPLTLNGDKTFDLSHAYADDGTYTVTIAVNDNAPSTGTAMFVVTVTNSAPTITNFTVPNSGQEGTAVVMTGTASDPGGANDPLVFTWTVTRPDTTTFTLSGTSVSFTPAVHGSYGVTLTVSDDDGGSNDRSATVIVFEPPVVTAAHITLSGATGVGGAFRAGDIVTATWDNSVSGDNNSDVGPAAALFSTFASGFDWPGSMAMDATGNLFVADGHNTNVVFKVTPDGQVSPFVGPAGGLTFGPDGALYLASGNVWRVTPDGTKAVFATGFDGPAALAFDAQGILYVANLGNNTVSKRTADGQVSTFATGFTVPAGIAVDGAGYVYVANCGDGTIRKLAPSGEMITFARGLSLPVAVAALDFDASGNLYVSNWGSTYSITPDGVVRTLPPTTASAGIVVDERGIVYVSQDYVGTIAKGEPYVTMDFGQFGGGVVTAFNDGAGHWRASYRLPDEIQNANGLNVTVNVMDHDRSSTSRTGMDNAALVAVDTNPLIPRVSTGLIDVSGATGLDGSFRIGDVVKVTWDNSPTGDHNSLSPINAVLVDFSQFGGGSLPAVEIGGGFWSVSYTVVSGTIDATNRNVTLAVTNSEGHTTITTGINNVAVDNQPSTMTEQNVQVTPGTGIGGTYRAGDTVTVTWNSGPTGDNDQDLAPGFASLTSVATFLDWPMGVAIDSVGNLYVANDYNSNNVIKITPSGSRSIVAGNPAPGGMAVDSDDNIYFASIAPGGLITKITASGGVSTFASGLSSPVAVAIDAMGNLFVANAGNNTISKITPDGTVSPFASGFNQPASLAVDAAGYIYVVNRGDSTIKQVTPDGVVSTYAAGFTWGVSVSLSIDASGNLYVATWQGNGGPISRVARDRSVTLYAYAYSPGGMTIDRQGNLYVTQDYANNVVKVTPHVTVDFTEFGGGVVPALKDGAGNWNASYQLLSDAAPGPIAISAVDDAGNIAVREFHAPESPSLIVTTADDTVDRYDYQTSLREALTYANSHPGADTITFDASLTSGGPATIRLNGAELVITSDVTITGPGADLLTISGDSDNNGSGNSRIFNINDGNGVADRFVAISGLTLTKGSSGDGGAIHNRENLTATNSTLSDNSAYAGAGIYNNSAMATLTNVTFRSNSADRGGGIYNHASSPTLTNVTLSGNYASYAGGGIWDGFGSSPTLTNVTLSGNSAAAVGGGLANTVSSSPTLTNVTFSGNSSYYCGGLYNDFGSSPTLNNVTFSNNSAYQGGGMLNYASQPTLTNVTFSSNSAYQGGGMFNVASSAPLLTNVTFSSNSATYGGGGIFNENATARLTNTIVATNSGPVGPDVYGLFSSNGSNLIGNSSDSSGWVGTDLLNVDPLLGSLGDYGGPTQTIPLLPGSPAINAGASISGWWKLNEGSGTTAADSSGSGATATLVGAGTSWATDQPPTLTGGSLHFAGTGSYALVPNLDANVFTVMAWVKRDESGYRDRDSGILLSTNYGGWGFGFRGPANSDHVFLTHVGYSNVVSTGQVTDTTGWHQIAVSYDGAVARFYIDGQFDSAAYYGVSFNSFGGSYGIGDSGHPDHPQFHGNVADLRVFSQVLTDAQIASIYAAPATDQRHTSRDAQPDIGAFESHGFTMAVTGGNDQSTPINTQFPLSLQVTVTPNAAGEPVDGGLVTFADPPLLPSAVITGSPATISGGTASVTATANGVMGSYLITASANGTTSADFTLHNTETPSLAVTTTDDIVNPYDGLTSLREAIAYANSSASGVVAAGFLRPMGITFDTAGNLYVATEGPTSVSKVTPDGQVTPFVTGLDLQGAFWLTFDLQGNLYLTDHVDGVVSKVTPGGQVSTVVSGLSYPEGIAFDASGNLYVASDYSSIYKVTPAGDRTLFATGFFHPGAMTFDSLGNLYVSNYYAKVSGAWTGTVEKITPDGQVSDFATGFDPAGSSRGLVFDGNGNLYVANNNAGTITKLTPTGGRSSFATGLESPFGLAIDSHGDVHVSELSADRIQKFPTSRQITFDPSLTSSGPATIRLNGTELAITSDVTITGPGAELLTINADSDNNGSGNSRIFNINDGNGVADRFVAISGLTLTKGGSDITYGGAIDNREQLTLSNSSLLDNWAYVGGGIYNNSATATLTNCTLSGNWAWYYVGGGGIYNINGTVALTNCTLSGNVAYYGSGAGIYNSNSATASLMDCTLSGNTAWWNGGGIFNLNASSATLTNTTLSGNVADYGSGIFNHTSATATLANSTLSRNTARQDGGGIFNNGTAYLANTIVATNLAGSSSPDVRGAFSSNGNNLIGNTSGSSGWVSSDLQNLDALLTPLGNYGGPTQTMALLPGSPAIDAGSNVLAVDQNGQPLTTDQRGAGYARVLDGNGDGVATVDIGAFERVEDHPPQADAGGPYSVAEGSSIQLDASSSSDPDLPNDTLSYAWDFDADGQYDDATGPHPTFSAATLDGPGSVTVGLRVTDAVGASSTDTVTVNITNVVPTLSNVAVSSPIDEGGTVHLTGTIIDPGTLDTFTLTVDWGVGLAPETFHYAAGTTSFHETYTYADDNPTGTLSDNYTVRIGLSDDDWSQTEGWSSVASIPSGFYADGGAVLSDQKWYLFEVKGSDPKSMKLEAYDAATNTWTPRATPPTIRAATGVAGVGDKLYVIAGWLNSDSNSSTNLVEIYNATTNQWTTGAPASRSRGSMAAAAIGSKIYVTGGRAGNGSPDDATLEIYDTLLNSWTTGAPLPTARENVSAEVIDGRMYVVGGYIRNPLNWYDGQFTGTMEIYDPATDQWTTGTPMPTPRWDPAVSVLDGKLYVSGGLLADGTAASTVEVYDPSNGAWCSVPSMPTARWYPQGATLDGRVYVAAGLTGGVTTTLNVVEANTPAAQATTCAVVTVKNVAPLVNAGLDANVYEGSIFMRSGSFTDPGADTWTAMVDYGNGSGSQPLMLNMDKTFDLSHVYADNGTYHVTVTVNDDDLGSGSSFFDVFVANVVPSADDDGGSTLEDQSVTVIVLDNDTDPAGINDPLQVVSITPGAHGSVVINPDSTVTYIPNDNFNGSDSFSYTVDDGDGGTAVGVVHVMVDAVNDAPVAEDGNLTVLAGSSRSGSLVATDVDGDSLTYHLVSTANAHGTVVLQPNGSFTYTPDPTYFGAASFTFAANDNSVDSNVATVSISVTNGVLVTLPNTAGLAFRVIRDGNNLVVWRVNPLNPTQRLGTTPHFTQPGIGDIRILQIEGGSANDNVSLDGSLLGYFTGTVVFNGNDGNDRFDARVARTPVALNGGIGNDTLVGGKANDSIDGGTGNDSLLGNDGADLISGGTGRDTIQGGAGGDTISGGDDNDLIYGGDNLTNTGDGNDKIHGDGGNDTIKGGLGQDTLCGDAGNDSVQGDTGDDLVNGGEGADTLNGNDGNDTLLGGVGNDVLYGGAQDDQLLGQEGDDLILGHMGNDRIDGGSGNDTLRGLEGSDSIFGGSGNDKIAGGLGHDLLLGGTGNDYLHGGELPLTVYLTPRSDWIYGADGSDTLHGGLDTDTVNGGNGVNVVLQEGLDSIANLFTFDLEQILSEC